jgi:hypothetical protein
MRSEDGAPRLGRSTFLNDLQERPNRPLRRPSLNSRGIVRIGFGNRLIENGRVRGKEDVRTDPVVMLSPKDMTELLSQPPLNAATGNRNKGWLERIEGRLPKHEAERRDQRIRPLRPMNHQHGFVAPTTPRS